MAMGDELRCVAPTGDVCGEGAVWAAAEGRLYWTDINRFLVHSLTVADGSVRTWFFDEPVVALALTDRPGVMLAALASRLILFTPAEDGRAPLGPALPGSPLVRFNDGRPDPLGRMIIGTMGNNVGPAGEGLEVRPGLGKLYRFGPEPAFVELAGGIGIANTICWSPDERTFYFADTMANEIRAYAFDPVTGAVGASRPFFAGFGRGSPDGSAVDSAGYLWNARYGGGCLVRVAPDGSVERVVEMPCGNITTCTFGGEGLRTLYITTAAAGRGPSERLAGSLFALEAPVPGLPERVFRPG
jgi:sugar lactone lactonase YvrE